MDKWLSRTEKLIGTNSINKLKNSKVIIFGVGGVGSFTIEALVRSGVGTVSIVDNDVIAESNINRQLIAKTTNIGKPKVEEAKKRCLEINPNLEITTYQIFYDEETKDQIDLTNYDYIIDCIDSVKSKLLLIKQANDKNLKIISSMGTGNKLESTMFKITDISKTKVCTLAKKIRKELKLLGIKKLKVVYSEEELKYRPQGNESPASISFVPSVAGLILAGEVIKELIK